jgi:hypothetical protein
MIHDNYTIIKLHKTLKIIDQKTKQPQPSIIIKPFFFFKIKSTYKITFKRWKSRGGGEPVDKINRELSGLTQKLSSLLGLGASVDSVEKEKTSAALVSSFLSSIVTFWEIFSRMREFSGPARELLGPTFLSLAGG